MIDAKRFAGGLLFALVLARGAAGQDKRTFYVDAGAGTGCSYYSFYDSLSSDWTLDSSWFVSAGAGWAPFQFVYVTAGFAYNSERNSRDGQALSAGMTTLSAGFRFYPLKSRKYLQVGLEAGPSFINWANEAAGVAVPAGGGPGFSVTGMVMYDVSRELVGPAAQAGVHITWTATGGESILNAGLCAKIALKGLRKKGAPQNTPDDTRDMVLAFPLVALLGTATACWAIYRGFAPGDRSSRALAGQ